MSKVLFIFIAASLILLQVKQLESVLISQVINAVCIIMLLMVGVSHGAIDNILSGAKTRPQNIRFIVIYLGLILINTILWLIFPDIGLLFFLLLSAFHFGESQFVHYRLPSKISWIVYLSWGMVIVSGIIQYNTEEINQILNSQNLDLPLFYGLSEYSDLAFYPSLALTLMSFIYLKIKNLLKTEKLLLETYILILILISFHFFSILIGFSLYFIILHSFRVLLQEYRYLKEEKITNGPAQFIKLLLPFTLLSIVGMGLILFIIQFFSLEVSLFLVLLILTSNVTLPHSFVMNKFYALRFNSDG